MTAKTRNTFSNYAPGYAQSQLVKLRLLRHRQTQSQSLREARITALETFNDYQEKQRVGGEVR